MKLIERIIHRWLHLPYELSIRYKRLVSPLKTTYIFIHGLADTGEMWKPTISQLPKNANYIVIDLLGHGSSRHPDDEHIYSAPKQAQSVMISCLKAGLAGPVVLVGHSFGSLVASEFAYGYKGVVQQLILVSPPIYRDESQDKKSRFSQDSILRSVYRQLLKQPELIINGYNLIDKLKLVGFSSIKVNKSNYIGIANTLKSGIINQRAAQLLTKSTIPVTIIYGKFDPLLVPKNFESLKKVNPNIVVKPLPTGHAIRNATVKKILSLITTKQNSATFHKTTNE